MSHDATTAPAAETHAHRPAQDRIYLVGYPKIVFMYPTFLAAIAAGIAMLFLDQGTPGAQVTAVVFLGIFAANLVIMAFDFPRTTSLTIFFFLVAVGVALWVTFRLNPGLAPQVTEVLKRLNPQANATFYWVVAVLFGLIYVGIAVGTNFDYWEIRPNELLHHHGFLSDLKRYSAPNLRIDKEINDIFEYMLLRSGRLILHPSHERRAIVLDHVFFVGRKEEEITRMLGALQVQVRPSDE